MYVYNQQIIITNTNATGYAEKFLIDDTAAVLHQSQW